MEDIQDIEPVPSRSKAYLWVFALLALLIVTYMIVRVERSRPQLYNGRFVLTDAQPRLNELYTSTKDITEDQSTNISIFSDGTYRYMPFESEGKWQIVDDQFLRLTLTKGTTLYMMIEFYDKSAVQRGYIEMHIVNPNMLRWYPGADRKIHKGKAYMQFERRTIDNPCDSSATPRVELLAAQPTGFEGESS